MTKKLTEFHRILKHSREKMNLSQAILAKELDIKKSTYSALEANKRPVPKRVYNELDKHINFEQFELRESLLEDIEMELKNLSTHQLLCLVWKLQNIVEDV